MRLKDGANKFALNKAELRINQSSEHLEGMYTYGQRVFKQYAVGTEIIRFLYQARQSVDGKWTAISKRAEEKKFSATQV